ncbi:MAG: PEPxxWA-CTERM sorting domain-containing protein [Caulobacteraceae bacterium]
MRTILSLALAGSALVALVATTAAASTIVYDNGGVAAGANGNETVAWVQAEDFSFATATTIDGAGVYIASTNGFQASDGQFQYDIFADNGGSPGPAPIATGAVTPTITDTGISWCCGGNAFLYKFQLASSFNAAAGTKYWLGIHAGAPSNFTRDEIYWVATAANATETGHESLGGTFNNWSDNGIEHAFYLTGGAGGVPEPATWAMMLAGFGLAGASLRRRPATKVA